MNSGVVFDQVVGAVLALYRKEAGLNQHQAVEGTKIGASSLSKLEKGDYSLTMEQLFEISKKYEVNMADIVERVEITHQNIIDQGVNVEKEKKANTTLLLLGAAALVAFIASR